jgi:hypothetical protein
MNVQHMTRVVVRCALAATVTARGVGAQLHSIEPSMALRNAPASPASVRLLALAASPSRRGFVLSARASGAFGDSASPGAFVPAPWVHLSYRQGASGAWIGSRFVPAPAVPAAAPFWEGAAQSEAGIWRQLGGAIVSLTVRRGNSAGSRTTAARRGISRITTRVDSIDHTTVTDTAFSPADDSGAVGAARAWSAAEGRVSWGRGRWALDLAAGTTLGSTDLRATLWRRGEASLALTPRVALVAAGGTSPGMSPFLPVQRFGSLGLRLSARAFAPGGADEPIRPVPAAFAVERAGDSSFTLTVRVPRARSVEVSGDFTAWKPVPMRSVGVDRWETTVRMSPGTYRVSIRVDGDAWIAPPGVAAVHDEFVGTTGLIVVE